MYKIEELEYLLGFFSEGIANKKSRLSELLRDSENISCHSFDEKNNPEKLKNKILQLEIIVLEFKARIFQEKIKKLNNELHKIETKKIPLLDEASGLLKVLLSEEEAKGEHHEYRQLNHEISELEAAQQDIQDNLNKLQVELNQIVAALSQPSYEKVQVSKAKPKSVRSFACSPPFYQLLGFDQPVTLDVMLDKVEQFKNNPTINRK